VHKTVRNTTKENWRRHLLHVRRRILGREGAQETNAHYEEQDADSARHHGEESLVEQLNDVLLPAARGGGQATLAHGPAAVELREGYDGGGEERVHDEIGDGKDGGHAGKYVARVKVLVAHHKPERDDERYGCEPQKCRQLDEDNVARRARLREELRSHEGEVDGADDGGGAN
jgi:hypothetical protein